MASIARNGKGWRAQVRRIGHPTRSKTFAKKTEAWAWAAQQEKELTTRKRGEYPRKTILEALEKFRDEEAPKHKGERWERVRTLAFERYPIAKRVIQEVTDNDFAVWREDRLKQVKKGTVRRELVLWGQVFEAAREKWRWIPSNPLRLVKKPSPPPTIPRPVPQTLIDAMVKALGDAPMSRQTALGYLLGCETAMRPWEMLSVTKDQVFWRECYLHLDKTKNGDERDVPLTPGAIEILVELEGLTGDSPDLFTVGAGSVTKLWSDARTRAGYTAGVHFRHSRREGIRRLSKRLEILDLARSVGHRDLKSLMIYYQESAADLARLLVHQPKKLPASPSSVDEPRPNASPAAGKSGQIPP